MTTSELKEKALQFGADLVGVGSMSRFEGTDEANDPRFIAPAARSIVGLGFRVLRGSLRGIEEGTNFFQYPEMGVVHIDEVYAPMVLRKLACYLEDNGFEAVVQRSVPDRRPQSDPGTNPEHASIHRIGFSEPVAPGRPAPDVLMDFRQAAFICGLGEIGLGGFVLTPEFGPFQRFAFILTDAELENDELHRHEPLCDRCGQCMAACPGAALSTSETERLQWCGQPIEQARLDEWQCAAYYMGAAEASNPFLPRGALDSLPKGREIAAGTARLSEQDVRSIMKTLDDAYPGVRFGYNASICGRACYRACYVHLEDQGKLLKRFGSRFRKKAPWKLNQ